MDCEKGVMHPFFITTTQMKKVQLLILLLVISSFISKENLNKYLLGKWEMIKLIMPDKKEIDIRQAYGESYLEFKEDHTFEETGSSSTKGTWTIIDKIYLQTINEGSKNFSQKMKIKQVSSVEVHIEDPDKTIMVLKRINNYSL